VTSTEARRQGLRHLAHSKDAELVVGSATTGSAGHRNRCRIPVFGGQDLVTGQGFRHLRGSTVRVSPREPCPSKTVTAPPSSTRALEGFRHGLGRRTVRSAYSRPAVRTPTQTCPQFLPSGSTSRTHLTVGYLKMRPRRSQSAMCEIARRSLRNAG
jgi:hypothetical protein